MAERQRRWEAYRRRLCEQHRGRRSQQQLLGPVWCIQQRRVLVCKHENDPQLRGLAQISPDTHAYIADIQYTKLCLSSVPLPRQNKRRPLPWQCASARSAMSLPMTSRHCANCRWCLLKYSADSKSQRELWEKRHDQRE